MRATHSEAAKELRERLRGEHAKIRSLETELEQARGAIAVAEAAAAEEADRLRDERRPPRPSATPPRPRDDAATAERDAAMSARDEALQKLSAVEGERDALAEARDRARLERNAWMSRARAATAGRPSAGARAVPKPLADARAAAPEHESDPTDLLEPPPEVSHAARSALRAPHDPDRRAAGARSAKTPGLACARPGVGVLSAGLGPAACRRAGPGPLRGDRGDRAVGRRPLGVPRRRSPASAPAQAPRRAPRRSSSPGGRSSHRGPPPARRRGRLGCAPAGSRP